MPPSSLTREQVRNVDAIAIERFSIPGILLMENAGRNTAELLIEQGINGPVVICCGKGNNGGDGFVIARHLENAGHQVQVLLFADPQESSGDALTNYRILLAAGTAMRVVDSQFETDDLNNEFAQADWIVDALLGTGTQGEIRAPYDRVIDSINAAGKRVLAVDLPSGLDCDTGEPLSHCIRATLTATFVARKLGFANNDSRDYAGDVQVIDIGVPKRVIDAAL